MFNHTLVSATQMLSPLWSEQIVKYFTLDYRYCTVFTMLINAMCNLAAISEEVALCGAISVVSIMFLFHFSKNKKWIREKKSGSYLTFVTSFDASKHSMYDHPTGVIEEFLYKHPHFFLTPPHWSLDAKEIIKIGEKIGPTSSSTFLNDGTYRVNIENEICFTILVKTCIEEKQLSKRMSSIQFSKGNEQQLFAKIQIFKEKKPKKNNQIYMYPLGITVGFLQDKNKERSIFSGFYHPQLNFLLDWIDNLDRPAKHGQSRQFSILCHGKSGTGKTAIVKRLAEYTNRNVVFVNLMEIKKKKDLIYLFYFAEGFVEHGESFFGKISSTIFFLDEFDKAIKRLKILKDSKKNKEEQFFLQLKSSMNVNVPENGANKEEILDKDEIDWDIDDLLEIFCGSYIPEQRMIVASCNDIEIIHNEYPFLARPGRLTPISFDYGDKHLLKTIVQDYVGIDLDVSGIDNHYRFCQAHLIEYLQSKNEHSTTSILSELPLFQKE